MSVLFPILLAVQILTCIAMIGVILLQRSEGGGLGMGGGGGVGGLMTGRGAANALTRTTVILATIFIVTSMALALVVKATRSNDPLAPTSGAPATSPLTTLPAGPTPGAPPAGPAAPGAPPAIPVPASPAPSTAPATPQPAPAAPPAQPASGGTP